MKKHLTTLFLFAATMMTAFMLSGCGEEVNIEGPVGPNEEGLTVFSQVPDEGTRTTMGENGWFYWQSKRETNGNTVEVTRDQIWVDEDGDGPGTFTLQSASSAFENNDRTGRFYFLKALGENQYNLSYTGFGSTSGDKATISPNQVQSKWCNSEHIGTSGDCATATATKATGTSNYSFKLQHKSSYLIFKPYAKKKTNVATNFYRLTEIKITDLDGNELAGTFPLTMDGLQTNGATNTTSEIRLTCGQGFHLPTDAPADTAVAYAVMLPRGHRNLRVTYSVATTSDGFFQVYENISGTYEANRARLISHELKVPVQGPGDPDPNFISGVHTNPTFGGVKFKPAFLRRTNGNATTNATLELDADPFVLLNYNQGAHNVATAQHIDNTRSINSVAYRLPTLGEYSALIETPNAGRATVNYYPASFAAVKVDLSADATYSTKGWNSTSPSNANVNADYIMGYLFFPDNMVVLATKILVASLNGRWSIASTLTADDLRSR